MSAIPEIRGPILDTVVRKKLYKCATELMIPLNQILSFNLKEIGHQIMIQKSNDETAEDVQSYNGPFNNIPKEIMFKIFSYLNLYSLGNMQVKHKAIIQGASSNLAIWIDAFCLTFNITFSSM